MPASPQQPLSRWLVLLMAFATGLAVASNYYNQPLLQTLASQFGISSVQAGSIVTTAQISYACGLLLLVPLGDLLERRRLIVSMTLLAAFGLLLSALAPVLAVLLIGTALAGMFSVVAQVLVPLSASMASPQQRGRVVGTLMSGLLLGILLARTAAGLLAELGDWRLVYLLASVALALTALALWRVLPRSQQSAGLSYPQLLGSVLSLLREEPVLRWRALLGGICFALFTLFWTPLAFLLSAEPYGYSEGVIGLFGVVGAIGALAAGQAGRMADRGQSAQATLFGLLLATLSWLPLAFGGESLLALLAGVLLLDLAVQLVHVINLNQVYRLRPEARNRLNAGYMICYFAGGALGSLTSASLYGHFGWLAVCAAGGLLGALGLLAWLGQAAALEARAPALAR